LTGVISAQDASCSLAKGVCSVTLVNESPTAIELEACHVAGIGGVNVTTTTYTASSELTTTTYIAFANGSTSTVISTRSSSIAAASTVTDTVTEYLNVNGTVGGPDTVDIPVNSEVPATCAVPTAQFVLQTLGSVASGGFTVKFLDSVDSYSAGTETNISFEGTWS